MICVMCVYVYRGGAYIMYVCMCVCVYVCMYVWRHFKVVAGYVLPNRLCEYTHV